MSTQSDIIPIQSPRLRVQVRLGIPSLRAVVLGLVALLILFRWLHLMLALQTAAYGREMQTKSQELRQLERQNSLLQSLISEAESPITLAEHAERLDLLPRAPVYLSVDVIHAEDGSGVPDGSGSLLCADQPEATGCQDGRRPGIEESGLMEVGAGSGHAAEVTVASAPLGGLAGTEMEPGDVH